MPFSLWYPCGDARSGRKNREWLLPADADYSMIYEIDLQPGAGSQPDLADRPVPASGAAASSSRCFP